MQLTKVFAIMVAAIAMLLAGRAVVESNLPGIAPNSPVKSNSSLSHQHRLLRKWDEPLPASDELWQSAICRGQKLIAGMLRDDASAGALLSPPQSVAQSIFTGDFPNLFQKWGWHREEVLDTDDLRVDCDFDRTWGIQRALNSIGSSSLWYKRGGHFWCWNIWHYDPYDAFDEHDNFDIEHQTYEADGRTYRMTGAQSLLAVNPTEGVIVTMNRQSPAHTGRDREPPITSASELPALRSSSDISWAAYAIQGGGDNLRFMFSISIMNKETLQLIKRSLDGKQSVLKPWPGTSFKLDSEAGQALLGSPNGRAFGFLVMQRKRELGRKFIDTVIAFECENARTKFACLVFRVQPVPPQFLTNVDPSESDGT